MAVYNLDVKKITMTPVAQMAAKMMNSAGIVANPTVSLTEGEKLLKLLKLENRANLHVDANIIKTATNYAVQMCPSKEGTFAIKKCSTAMLAVDGQTLKTIAEIAASFMAGIVLLVRIIGSIVNSFCPIVTPREKEDNTNIIDIPPEEDNKPIIETPTPVPQEPSVTDISSGKVEEKELGRDIFPKTPADEDNDESGYTS